ncbi:MAG: isopentenyl-diphosphate Delta-isomerase [Bacteroidales bacterium]
MTKQNYVVLVDPSDKEIGIMEKNQAHLEGVLHRAVSVFIFNSKGEWLLQRRASHKYHSAGEWSNTSCTHPFRGETYHEAAQRRVFEEMGIKPQIQQKFQFIYKAELCNEMTEHELDTVFIGFSDEEPVINESEVCDYRYMTTSDLLKEVEHFPERYTPWFKKLFPRIKDLIEKEKKEHIEDVKQS